MHQRHDIDVASINSINTLIGKTAFASKTSLRAIVDWYNLQTQTCRTSIERLAESAGLSITIFRAQLKELESKGFITRADAPGRPANGTSTINWNIDIIKIRETLEPLLRQQSEDHKRKRPKLTKAQLATREARAAIVRRLEEDKRRLEAEKQALELENARLEAELQARPPVQAAPAPVVPSPSAVPDAPNLLKIGKPI